MTTVTDIRYYPRGNLVLTVHGLLASGLVNALTMFAARRMGKTQFIRNELLPAAEAWRWRACYVDLWVRRDEPELALVEELERGVREQDMLSKLAPDKIKAKASYADNQVEAEWSRKPVSSDLHGRLRLAMQGLAAAGPMPVLLVLDEFQALAAGKHLDFLAAFRATMQELQPKLKIFFTGSSRDALNDIFRKRKAPLFESAISLPLPELDDGFVEDRAVIFKQMTGREMQVSELSKVFHAVAHTPMYLNQIIMQTVVSLTADPWNGFRRWQEEMGDAGLRSQWAKLKPVDRIILQHLANGHAQSLFGTAFSEVVSSHLKEDKPYNPQRIQTAVNRLVKHMVLAPKETAGEYEIEDRALAIYIASVTTTR